MLIPGGTAEINATIKDLKDAGIAIPTTSTDKNSMFKVYIVIL